MNKDLVLRYLVVIDSSPGWIKLLLKPKRRNEMKEKKKSIEERLTELEKQQITNGHIFSYLLHETKKKGFWERIKKYIWR